MHLQLVKKETSFGLNEQNNRFFFSFFQGTKSHWNFCFYTDGTLCLHGPHLEGTDSFFCESRDYCLPPLGQTPVAPFKFEIILHLAYIRLGASIIEIMRAHQGMKSNCGWGPSEVSVPTFRGHNSGPFGGAVAPPSGQMRL